jgi:urea transport system substrate-binding protein
MTPSPITNLSGTFALRPGFRARSWTGASAQSGGLTVRPHLVERRRGRTMRLGLLVPFRGADAIWGPSCQFSAVLAAAELNEQGGILGREVELFAADAGGAPEGVVARTAHLVDAFGLDALIGVHLSSVRVALRQAFGGVVPYVFAPLYEGGETSSGVFAIGETPDRQFPDAVRWLIAQRGARRWFLAGNDYVWPRASHVAIRKLVMEAGGEVVGEDYIGLGANKIAGVIRNIADAQPDVVFESLVGSDCVRFNRTFARAGLSSRTLRLSGAIEENTLFGIGERHTQNLYCVASYFSALTTDENRSFLQRYRQAFGATAPVQGVLSQSCYEAIRFFAALTDVAGSTDIGELDAAFEGLEFYSARGTSRVQGGAVVAPIYLARAEGTAFEIIEQF